MLKDMVMRNRSYRRFSRTDAADMETLKELIALARLTPSGGNLQPLKYILSCSPATNDMIFRNLAWAAYLKDWPGPADGERPSAYIIILGDKSIAGSFAYDSGIAAQTMLLGAVEKGLGGCIIASVTRKALTAALDLPGHLEILLVLALGKPAEEVVIDPLGPEGKVQYWRDARGAHHVPKRSVDELIFKEFA